MPQNDQSPHPRPAPRWREQLYRLRARLPQRLQHEPLAPLALVAIVVVVLTGIALVFNRTAETTASAVGLPSAEAAVPAAAYPRGPHGGRLLSDSGLQIEIAIYEAGVPPRFRVYPFDDQLKPLAPQAVDLQIELHRLGGRVDRIAFRPEADYLQGEAVVEEPHSFDVKVIAAANRRRSAWSYSQIEGKVRLGDDQLASAGITIAAVGPRRMVTTVELPGEVKANETRLAHVVPRLHGVVTDVFKQEGDRVRRGELMAVLNSRELADAKSAYLAAAHHVEFTGTTLAREEALWKKKISAERDYLEAKRAFDESSLAKRLAEQTLIVLGVPKESLAGLADAPAESMARYEIRAPLDGQVIERNVAVGEAVAAEEEIFRVADLSTVWIEIAVYAKDLAQVREGQDATVRSTDLDRSADGRVSYVGPLVGQETRAATARIVLPNSGNVWRPGLFVTVELVRSATTTPLAVSADAIQTFRDWQVVFVRHGDWFEARPLELGRSDGQWVEVLKGLSPGERYAAKNSFAVKAEIGKLGATHDH